MYFIVYHDEYDTEITTSSSKEECETEISDLHREGYEIRKVIEGNELTWEVETKTTTTLKDKIIS